MRGIAIFFIVFGHLLKPIITSVPEMLIYFVVYLFQVPLIVYISGRFSSNNLKKTLKEVFCIYLPLLLILNIPYKIIENLSTKTITLEGLNFFKPSWILWYLLSLIFWKISICFFKDYFWKKENQIKILVFVSIIACLFGFIPIDGRFLAIERTLVFLPFFYYGQFTKFNEKDFYKENKIYLVLFILGLVFLLINIALTGNIKIGALYHAERYGIEDETLFLRISCILFGFSFIDFFRKKIIKLSKFKISNFFNIIGKYTLSIYLIHGIIVRGFYYLSFKILNLNIIKEPNYGIFICIFLTFVICYLFGYIFKYIKEK